MDDYRLLHLAQNAAVDARIILRALRGTCERPACHYDELSPHAFDCLDLLLVGADNLVDRNACVGVEMVGADAAGDLYAWAAFGGIERAADQLLRAVPIEPHAALRGVHRFGDAEPEI